MRILLLTVYIVLAAVGAAAQPTQQPAPSPQQQALAHKAHVELWTGIGFVLAGTWIAPLTSVGDSHSPPRSVVWGGFGLIGVGGTLVCLGMRDRQQAQHPSTNVGVVIGPRVAVQVRRRW
jgi:hypothetical protein